jgi:hypothetical protein
MAKLQDCMKNGLSIKPYISFMKQKAFTLIELHIRTCFDSTCPAQTQANSPEIVQDIIYVD